MTENGAAAAIRNLLIASVRDFRRQETQKTRMIAWSRVHALSEALAHVTGETPTKVLDEVYEVVGPHREVSNKVTLGMRVIRVERFMVDPDGTRHLIEDTQ